MFEFSANPYLYFEKISYETLDVLLKNISLNKLIESAINNEKYALVPIDMYEIPFYRAYKKHHRIHHPFIIGYDNSKEVFYLFDNFNEGKYQEIELPYDLLSNAYNTLISNDKIANWSETRGICLFNFYRQAWRNNKSQLFSINLDTIRIGICEYLLQSNYGEEYRHITHYSYGIDCYNQLTDWLEFGLKNQYVDHRAFSSIRDHKKVMLFRLEYIQKKFQVDLDLYIQEYTKIKSSLDIVINKIIKGNISRKQSIYTDCIDTINSIKKSEIRTLTTLIDLLQSIPNKLYSNINLQIHQ